MAVIRDSVNATIMLQHINSWQQSGITQVEYCRRHRITLKKFEYWLRKSRNECALQFIPVSLQAELPVRQTFSSIEPSGLAVKFGGSAQLEIGKNFDSDTLVRFMRIVADL